MGENLVFGMFYWAGTENQSFATQTDDKGVDGRDNVNSATLLGSHRDPLVPGAPKNKQNAQPTGTKLWVVIFRRPGPRGPCDFLPELPC